jgi:hypothetical protein
MMFKVGRLEPWTTIVFVGSFFFGSAFQVQAQTSEAVTVEKIPTQSEEQNDSEREKGDSSLSAQRNPDLPSGSNAKYTPVETRNAEDSDGEDYPIDI